jgi:hypothetical protein
MNWKRSCAPLAACFCVSVALGVAIGFRIYSCIDKDGAGRKSGRYGALQVLRGTLIRYAEEYGQYSGRIEDAVPHEIVDTALRDRVLRYIELDRLDYKVAGQKYDPSGNPLIVSERIPQCYGFETGWFKIYQTNTVFCRGCPSPRGP